LTIDTASESETASLGRRLGEVCIPGTLIALEGDLGAGKTRFAKGLAAGLGVAEEVTSPTFVLMNLYEGRIRMAHLDLYRLEAPDLPSLGLFDVLPDSVVVVEWAEKAGGGFPEDRLTVNFEVTGETSRRLMFRAGGPRSAGLLKALNLSP
jgi:tRNA threonylcarbamoyladenosine biosynthesis protein TsaE